MTYEFKHYLANFNITQEIKDEKANYCDCFDLKLNLKKGVSQPGNKVYFSCHLKMTADRGDRALLENSLDDSKF